MTAGRRSATLVLAAGFCLATAQDTREPEGSKSRPPVTLEAYGDMDKSCREWTDSCATCTRRPNGSAGCSLPGIACQPSAVTCNGKNRSTGASPP